MQILMNATQHQCNVLTSVQIPLEAMNAHAEMDIIQTQACQGNVKVRTCVNMYVYTAYDMVCVNH